MKTQSQIPGKTVIITGGNTGLGYECAKTIAAEDENWHVIIASRNQEKAQKAVLKIASTSNKHIEAMSLDLASLASVRQFVKDFVARKLPPLRAVVCNAGIQIVSGTTYTEDGFEATFAVNHLGHFLLVNLLLRHLVAPARIVFVSSGTHDPNQWLNKLMGMPAPYYRNGKSLALPDTDAATNESVSLLGKRRYTTAKLCNIFCAYELSRRIESEGYSTLHHPISVNAFDPGLMPGSGLARDYSSIERFIWKFFLPTLSFFVPNVNSAEKSGKALARLISAPEFDGVSGKYFEGLKQVSSSTDSEDKEKAAELWVASAELVKLSGDERIWG